MELLQERMGHRSPKLLNAGPRKSGGHLFRSGAQDLASWESGSTSSQMSAKTLAARRLDTLRVGYELVTYDLGDSEFSAEAVAESVSMPAEQVFKTLVAIGSTTGPVFAVVPAGAQLDLKRLAAVSGNRKVALSPLKDVKSLTGYERGEVTVLAARTAFPVFIDETAELHEHIAVSGGTRGVQLLLRPQDYLRVTSATTADIAR